MRKSVYSKICKRHQFCEKSRRNVAAAANSQICKCKCQRQQPVQRMPSFRSGSHPTSKLLHVCFDKIVISVIIQLFKICTFTVSFWPPASPGSLCERERERRAVLVALLAAAAAAESPQRLFHSDPVTPLHSYSYCPTLEGIIFKRCNKKQPVCLSPKPPSR